MKRKLKTLLATVLSAALLVTPLTAFGAETPADPAEAAVTETETQEDEAELSEEAMAEIRESLSEEETVEQEIPETLLELIGEGKSVSDNTVSDNTVSGGDGTVSSNDPTVSGGEIIDPDTPLPEYSTEQDAYQAIKLNAAVQKNNTVKISWAPAASYKYKSFKLFARLKDDSAWSTTNLLTKPNQKSYVDKTNFAASKEDANYLDVYKLECYLTADCTGDHTDYITAAVPLLFTAETGDQVGMMNMMFSEMISSQAITYDLQVAEQNKEYDPAKAPKGFNAEQTTTVSSEELLTEADKWAIGKVQMAAVQAVYSASKPGLTVDTTYFNRVKAAYTLDGVRYISAPSNVIKYKYGPGSCLLIDIVGLKYTAKDNTGANKARYENFVKYDGSISQDEFEHVTNITTCAKNGIVIFAVPKDTNAKSFELLRSEKRVGPYKKVKAYNVSSMLNKELWKLNPTDSWIYDVFKEHYDFYALHYNSFEPEKEYVYKVRAVSQKGALGGSGDYGMSNTTELDKVQEFFGYGSSATQVDLQWRHDDCVKQYIVYRSKVKGDPENPVAPEGLAGYDKIGTVSGSSVKKVTYDGETYVYHVFSDKKFPGNADVDFYWYMVRPIYDTKKASDPAYNIAKCSDPDLISSTEAFAKVKALNVASDGLGKFKVTWTGLKGTKKYKLMRYIGSPKDKAPVLDTTFGKDGTLVYDIEEQGKKETASMLVRDITVEIGVNYYYGIKPFNDRVEGQETHSKAVKSVPSAVTNLKAAYRAYGTGARVTWAGSRTEKEVAEDQGYSYSFQIRADNGDWINWNSTTYDDTSSLAAGQTRTYFVRVRLHNSERSICSAEQKVVFKSGGTIQIYFGGQPIGANPYVINLPKGTRVDLTAQSSSGSTLNIVCTAGQNAVALQQSYNPATNILTFAFGGVGSGSQTFVITSADGATRTIQVNVP